MQVSSPIICEILLLPARGTLVPWGLSSFPVALYQPRTSLLFLFLSCFIVVSKQQ